MTHRRFALCATVLPCVVATTGIAGWLTGSLQLASVRAEYIPMAPSTAIGFLLMSAAVAGIAFDRAPMARTASCTAAGILSILAVIKLIEFATSAATLNLEAKLVARPGEFGMVLLARMSPLTAVGFVFTGAALTLLVTGRTNVALQVSGLLGSAIAVAGGTVALGYIFSAPLLYGGRIIPMALTTGVAFIGTGVALVALAGPDAVPVRAFTGGSARARLLRVFVPLTVLAVLVNGITTHIILANVEANPALLAAVFALGSAMAGGLVVSWLARSLGSAIDQAEVVMRESRDEMERRVHERTGELSAVNKELESFSYSVSHDLRAPLRHVVGFASLLQQSAGAQLDEQSGRHLARVIEAAKRMGTLIDDLLALSRTSRTALDKRQVELNVLVRDAQMEVSAQINGRCIQWHVPDTLPTVSVDPSLFRLVLVNLFSNAVKYTAPRSVAEIEVGTHCRDAAEVVVYVRDNGVGFDMKYADKLFGVFQRLHSAEQFEGTGIGLANVQRIVQRHGGRTWAKAEVGRGATFYVALPTGRA